MTSPGFAPMLDCEDVAWFRDQPEAARGAAAALGRRIGLGETRSSQLVLAVAELAGNIAKHADDGSLLLRVLRNEATAGVEVLAVDNGPGIVDVPAALRDGMSTAGTLGIGLGAIQRLADSFHIHSQPGLGTVQVARFWPHPAPPRSPESRRWEALPVPSAASRYAAMPGPSARTPANRHLSQLSRTPPDPPSPGRLRTGLL